MAAPKKSKPTSKKSKTSKVMQDVAKPGETRVDSTSRPVIVGHKSTIKQDPMFKETGDDPEESLARPARGKDLEPVSDEPLVTEELEESTEVQPEPETTEDTAEFTLPIELEEEPAPKEESDKKPEAGPKPELEESPEELPKEKKITITPDKKPETSPEKSKGKSEPEEPVTGDDAAKDTSSDEVKTKESADAKALAEQEARIAEVQKLVNSKEFFVPIGQVSRRSNYAVVTLCLLVIVAAAVGINFAVDAELIEIGVEPLTDFL